MFAITHRAKGWAAEALTMGMDHYHLLCESPGAHLPEWLKYWVKEVFEVKRRSRMLTLLQLMLIESVDKQSDCERRQIQADVLISGSSRNNISGMWSRIS